jgi:uncharacterized Zn ribbon protein
MDPVSANWRTSSFSSTNGGQCVELGDGDDVVLVRDTKDRGRGPVLRVTPHGWRRFTSDIKSR